MLVKLSRRNIFGLIWIYQKKTMGLLASVLSFGQGSSENEEIPVFGRQAK